MILSIFVERVVALSLTTYSVFQRSADDLLTTDNSGCVDNAKKRKKKRLVFLVMRGKNLTFLTSDGTINRVKF